MKIVKLNSSHILDVRRLFEKKKYMGAMVHSNYFVATDQDYVEYYHTAFSDTYLADLSSYHAYGAIDEEGIFQGLIGFYESSDDPSWYGTHIKNSGDKKVAQLLLDTAIKHNEDQGRLKFYTLWSSKHAKLLRRFTFSEWANERYDYFDEYTVPSKHQCKYNLHWQILYNRTLIPIDTVVRCTFLKNKYRSEWPNAGRL
jgi:hypothetical protein